MAIRVPVRTTGFVKEERLRRREGYLLVDHPHTDMRQSFMIELPGEEGLLQCGFWEFVPLDGRHDDSEHDNADGPPDYRDEPPANWEP